MWGAVSVTIPPTKAALDDATSRWLAPRSRAPHRGRILAGLSASWQAWWNAWELDRELAAGTNPQASAALAVRAQRITGRRSRQRVADGLARTLRSVRVDPPGFTAAARPDAGEVLAARETLASLERRLRAPEPVRPRGTAILGLLLTDCTSPLYRPAESGALGGVLHAAAAGLEPAGRRGAEPVLVASPPEHDEALR